VVRGVGLANKVDLRTTTKCLNVTDVKPYKSITSTNI
jgi:hypothetical protein